jgi:hypothetical protein
VFVFLTMIDVFLLFDDTFCAEQLKLGQQIGPSFLFSLDLSMNHLQ